MTEQDYQTEILDKCVEIVGLEGRVLELKEALEAVMESYDKDGHLLNFDVDIARKALEA